MVRSALAIASLLFLSLAVPSSTLAASFYVDADMGDDGGQGSRRRPWRTVARVNRAALPPGSTVHFRAGLSYGDDLVVPSSGTAQSPVGYTRYGKGAKPRLAGVDATGTSHVRISGLSLSSPGTVVVLAGASHVTVEGCDIAGTSRVWAPAVVLQNGAHHNRILDNRITQERGDTDAVNLRGNADYNLIEGNRITVAGVHCALALEGHTGRGSADFNIVRNNVIVGKRGGGSLIALQANSNHNLVEGNVLAGDESLARHCGSNEASRHQTMFKLVSRDNIVRNNIIRDYPCPDSLGLDMGAYHYDGFTNVASGNRVYNNVITGVSAGGTPLFLGENGTGGKSVGNTFKNNVVYNNGGTWYRSKRDGSWPRRSLDQQMKVQVSLNVRDNRFVNNIFFKKDEERILWLNDAFYSVEQAQSFNGRLFSGNLQLDPMLDPRTQRPHPRSPTRDAGAHLANVTSPDGSGLTVAVDDPLYFSDGFGLIPGDTVQINGRTARIAAIDYAAGTLTLATPLAWRRGDAVSLPYTGSAPDIGAFESPSPLPAAASARRGER